MKIIIIITAVSILLVALYGFYNFMTHDFPPNPEAIPENLPLNELQEQSNNPLETSRKIITLILDDVSSTYTLIPGGGIGSINQDSTDTYSIRLLREEATDVITYTVSIDETGDVKIINKVTSVDS